MTTASPEVARSPSRARPSPEEEALELIVRLADRVEVARSFARICAGLLSERAVRASVALRVGERVAEASRFARAAADAAATVAASEMRRVVSVAAPEPHEGEPEHEKTTPKKQKDVDDDDAPSSLDHEALHDDAC